MRDVKEKLVTVSQIRKIQSLNELAKIKKYGTVKQRNDKGGTKRESIIAMSLLGINSNKGSWYALPSIYHSEVHQQTHLTLLTK